MSFLEWYSCPVNGRLIPVEKLSNLQREALYGLFCQHFLSVDRDSFEKDLDKKNWTVILEDDEGTIKGLSSIQIYPFEHQGVTYTVVYSGDTVMDPSAWHSSVLSRTWIAAVKHLKETLYPGTRCDWLLISSGFRTYRFLPTFWQRFYPRFDEETPEDQKELMEAIALHQFGPHYDPTTGVVKLPHPQILRDELRGIPEERLKDGHVDFFHRSNPDHEAGDELVCLTEIGEDNLTRAGRRMWFSKTQVAGMEAVQPPEGSAE